MDNLRGIPHYQIKVAHCPSIETELDSCVGIVTVYAYLRVTGQFTAQDGVNPDTGAYNYKLVTVDDKILPFKATFKFKVIDDKCWGHDYKVRCCPPVTPVEPKGVSEQHYADSGVVGVSLTKHFQRNGLPNLEQGQDGERCCETNKVTFQWWYGELIVSAGATADGKAKIKLGGIPIVEGAGTVDASGTGAANGGPILLPVTFNICPLCHVDNPGDITDGEEVFNRGGFRSPR